MISNNLWKTTALVTLVLTGLLGGAGAAIGGVGKSKGKADPAAAERRGKADKRSKKASRKVRRGLTVVGETGEKTVDSTTMTPIGAAPAEPNGPARVVGRVVYGEAKGKVIATVDVKKVFQHIPSYRKIQQENLKKTKARYHFLISQANQAFQQAVEIEALTQSIDVVVEAGGVENAGADVVDLTDTVIKRIERN